MKPLLNFFFKLSPPLRVAVGVVILAAVVYGTHSRIIGPEKVRHTSLAKMLDTFQNSNKTKMKRIENLRSTDPTLQLTEAHEARLDQTGNSIVHGPELPAVIEEIKKAARKAGAKNVSVTEGEPQKKLVQLDNTAGLFTVSVLQLELTFQANYRKVSELLFSLRGMRLFLGIPEVRMESGNYTSNIDTTINLSLYYREEL